MLVRKSRPGEIICIEEPENGLHSHVQKGLFKEIKDSAKKKDVQFFITTHSPLFTSLEDIVATHLLTRSNAISEANLIDKDSQLKLIKQHLGIDNSDIYLSPWVIFVEGDSEEKSIPIVAEAMGRGEIGREIRLINYGGKGKTKNLKQVIRYVVKYFDTEPIVMGDGHKEIQNAVEDIKRRISSRCFDAISGIGEQQYSFQHT
jgi:putative ATP-dependent endonuclease of the OLD family